MRGAFWYLGLLAALVALPIILRPRTDRQHFDETLVIVSPHNEATRFEFENAFAQHYLRTTGKRVRIDWRTVGGTSEIARFLSSQYQASFRNYWVNTLHKNWDANVQSAFENPSSQDPARKAFLDSNVGCGIDLFFGGGSFDAVQHAAAGRLVDCGLTGLMSQVPQQFGGEIYWDTQGRWLGTCLSAFGICYNPVALKRLKIDSPPSKWSDLANPALFGNVALADPTQSGAAAKAFEMLIQEQMRLAADPAKGWANAMLLIRKLSANARYFTDSGTKVPLDVEVGDAAAGMCIDFYGRAQSDRLRYVTPAGGSSFGADPIGLLRGAPHPDLAKAFIAFVLSPEGQKLWNFKPGTPGGPLKYALRRLPILPALYSPEDRAYRSDPEVDPYGQTNVYHPEWTGPLFRPLSFLVSAMCIDPHAELRSAWQALIENKFPKEATALFEDVSGASYEMAGTVVKQTLRSPRSIEHVRLARELGDKFRARYQEVEALARKR